MMYRFTILNLGNRWRLEVGFTARPLYPRINRAMYPLDGRLGGPQSRSGRCGREKNLVLAGIQMGHLHRQNEKVIPLQQNKIYSEFSYLSPYIHIRLLHIPHLHYTGIYVLFYTLQAYLPLLFNVPYNNE
jgi:hypothetical protein